MKRDEDYITQIKATLDEAEKKIYDQVGIMVILKISRILGEDTFESTRTDALVHLILDSVCESFRITKSELTSSSRYRPLPQARQIAWRMLKDKIHYLSQSRIGKITGNRDHSTVIHGLKEYDKNYLTNKWYRDKNGAALKIFERKSIEN